MKKYWQSLICKIYKIKIAWKNVSALILLFIVSLSFFSSFLVEEPTILLWNKSLHLFGLQWKSLVLLLLISAISIVHSNRMDLINPINEPNLNI